MNLLLSTISISLFSFAGLAQTPRTQPSTSPPQRISVQDGDEYFPYLYLSDVLKPSMNQDQAKANIERYNKVIARNGKNVGAAYNNRATVYLVIGRPELALADLATALASNPEPEEASLLLNNRGYIFLSRAV